MNNLLVAGTMDVPAGWDFRFGDFLTDLFFQEGLAESTLQVLQIQLRAFNAWLLEATGRSWEHASVDDLQVFLLSWKDTRSVSALRLKQWMLQRLYRWAKESGIVDLGVHRALLPLRGGLRRPRRPPSSNAIAKLMELPDTKTAKGMRDPDYRYYQLRRMVSRYGRECGLRLTPHALRHAFASHLYQGKASLHTIQLLLGHEHQETTAHYVSILHEDIRAMADQHHPRSANFERYVRW